MKKSLLILIFLLAGVSGLAQEENGFRVPDSLMMKLKENEDENLREEKAKIIQRNYKKHRENKRADRKGGNVSSFKKRKGSCSCLQYCNKCGG